MAALSDTLPTQPSGTLDTVVSDTLDMVASDTLDTAEVWDTLDTGVVSDTDMVDTWVERIPPSHSTPLPQNHPAIEPQRKPAPIRPLLLKKQLVSPSPIRTSGPTYVF
jgi:hypothetical protein